MKDLAAFLLVFARLCSQVWLVRMLLRESMSEWPADRANRTPARRHRVFAALTGLAIAIPAHADEPAGPVAASAEKPLVISTDRPSFDDTAGIVPKGHLQLETGYTFTLNNHTDTQTSNAPEVLARYTIIDDRFELRLSTSGYVWSRTSTAGSSATAEGFSDAMVGFKLKILDQEGALPRLVLEGATTVGAGSDGISNQDVEPIGKLIWQYDLGKGWGIYGNLNIAYASSPGSGRFVQGQAGACVTYAASEKLSFYGEVFTFAPNAKGTSPAYCLDTGAAYLLTDRVQLDARVGFGLGRQSNNFFTGAGISFLF